MPYTCSIRVKSHDKLLKIYKNVESKSRVVHKIRNIYASDIFATADKALAVQYL